MGTMMDILAVGGAVSLFVTPGALVVIVGMGRTLRKLEERNGGQAAVIALMQQRLVDHGDAVVPMTEDARLRVWPSAAAEAEAWKRAWMRHNASKSCQNGTVGREVGCGIGVSTPQAPYDAVRANFESECG